MIYLFSYKNFVKIFKKSNYFTFLIILLGGLIDIVNKLKNLRYRIHKNKLDEPNFGSTQNTQITDIVHKLPHQSKLILLAIILHDKHFKKKYFFQRNKLKEIYEIYLELCKKTFVNTVDKKRFASITLDLHKIDF